MRKLLSTLTAVIAAVAVAACGSSQLQSSTPHRAASVAYHPGQPCQAQTRVAQVKYLIKDFHCVNGRLRAGWPPGVRVKGSGVHCEPKFQARYRAMGEVCKHKTLYPLKN